ncbi:MAG TPA: TonB-dependent receptor plug domain-containing protein [bacterium]|nr:TonB-dependent receptor plug domain-containing protein [bacterium]
MFSFQRKIFVFVLTGIILVSAANLLANNQVVSGYVVDNNDQPLSFSIVKKLNSEGYTICDQSGYFYLKNIDPQDTLEIIRYGYQSRTITKIDFSPGANLVIKLVPQEIQLQSVQVKAFSPELNNSSETFSRLGYTQELNQHDNKKVLSYLPGSYLKAYGGEAGTVTLSMNGAPASHTNVRLAGFNINNFQNGTIDFSNIPTDFIRNIVLLSANSTDFRNSGTEGTILLSPWTGENSITMGAGSFGYQKYSATAHRSLGKLNFNLYAGREQSNGDFEFYNKMTEQNTARRNNDFNQNYVSSKINGFLTDNIFIKSLLLYSEQERGIPGSISFPTPDAIQDDELTLFANQVGYLYEKG